MELDVVSCFTDCCVFDLCRILQSEGFAPFGLISLRKEANGWFRSKGTATAGRHQREEKKRKIEISSHKNSNKILSFLGKDVTSQGAEGGLS